MAGVSFFWSIAAPQVYLRRACDHGGVDRRAVKPPGAGLPGGGLAESLNDHLVDFPSFFCAQPAQFLGMLAYFLQRGIRFELALSQRDAESDDVLAFTRVFPRFDEATFRMLVSFDPEHARDVMEQQDRIAEALAQLRRTVSDD